MLSLLAPVLSAGALALCTPTAAVVFSSTADTTHNTTAPSVEGVPSDAGWQWVGRWGSFPGTPIGPRHFLAARHVGGNIGDSFEYRGVAYRTVASTDDTVSDLRLWEIDGEFPDWAPLYRTNDEVGRPLVVVGRGLGRGAAITVAGRTKGWSWGDSTTGNIQRWGRNTVVSTINGGSYWGELLAATFDEAGGADEAHLATGDSSGPVFIDDGTGWKLAGIAAAVDGPFSTDNGTTSFHAAIFDKRRLSEWNGSVWHYWAPGTSTGNIPSAFYATRVSARLDWIDRIDRIAPPPPASDVPLLPPGGTALLAAVLFGFGIRALRRVRPTILP